ncbi:MAG: galactose-binding domain-containing protein [Armatimonadota bacterium]
MIADLANAKSKQPYVEDGGQQIDLNTMVVEKVDTRHNKGAVFAFLDGHVEYKPAQTITFQLFVPCLNEDDNCAGYALQLTGIGNSPGSAGGGDIPSNNKAYDGNTTTSFNFANQLTTQAGPDWLQVNLGSSKTVKEVDIYNCWQGSLDLTRQMKGCTIYVDDNLGVPGTHSKVAAQVTLQPSGSSGPAYKNVVPITTKARGQYVTLCFTSSYAPSATQAYPFGTSAAYPGINEVVVLGY